MTTPDGLLIVDKPAGWTSHDVVARARRLCATRKVGHAGTLDPMATGVLVLGINRATKLLTFLVGCDKTYTATIRLGQSTITDDADGEIATSHDVSGLTAEAVQRGVAALTGDLAQVPSSVSAIKVNGQRSYARVRAGQDVVLPSRRVTVRRFDILDHRTRSVRGQVVWDLDVRVEVSSGTYIRALARDLGAALGVGGHLTVLRRTRVGRFGIEGAHSIPYLEIASEADGIPMVPLSAAARESFDVRELTAPEAVAIGYGQRIASQLAGRSQPIAAFAPDGHLVAMLDESGSLAKARVVFAPLGS
ncbi:MAG TPA: tRNA pseudouridine(55) synthase TruB [Dermatophilaceae bacterium]|jgi:tRNA pseudouridine55 synthase